MNKQDLIENTYYRTKLRQRIKLLYKTDNKIVILKQNGDVREIFSPLFIEGLILDKEQKDDFKAINTKEILKEIRKEIKDKPL